MMDREDLINVLYNIKDIINQPDGPYTRLEDIENLVDWALFENKKDNENES